MHPPTAPLDRSPIGRPIDGTPLRRPSALTPALAAALILLGSHWARAAAEERLFVEPAISPVPLASRVPTTIVAGKFVTGPGLDRFPDLVTASAPGSFDSAIALLVNLGGESFPEVAGIVSALHAPADVAAGDFDGNGCLDVVTAWPSPGFPNPGQSSVLLGNCDDEATFERSITFIPAAQPRGVVAADFDEDGHLDLAFNDTHLDLGIHVFLGNGTGRQTHVNGVRVEPFERVVGSPFAAGSGPREPVAADFDGDGHLDLAVPNEGSNDVTILLGDGAGRFSPAPGSPVSLGGRDGAAAVAGDFDEDGHLDLVVGHGLFQSFSLLLGDGFGGFSLAAGSPVTQIGAEAAHMATGDFDADGHLDVASDGPNVHRVAVFRGDGRGRFLVAPGSPYPVGTSPRALTAADLDSDGRVDLAVPNARSANATLLYAVPDTWPPALACSPPSQERWYASDVQVHCMATDRYSGLADATDAAFWLSTSVPAGTETESAGTESHEVCDRALNCATTGVYRFKVDRKGPELVCPDPPVFLLDEPGAAVTAGVVDGGSGPRESTVSSPADTASPGTHGATLTGVDLVGNTTLGACSYRVHYRTSGFLAPLANPPAVNAGRAGRSYPVRWRLQDWYGDFVDDLGAVAGVAVQPTSCAAFGGDSSAAIEPVVARGAGLRYDDAADAFAFNWQTPTAAGCYTLLVELASGQVLRAFFDLS